MNRFNFIRLAWLALLGLVLASCASTVPPATPGATGTASGGAQPVVWVMRHLETDETPERHLSDASAEQADRLARYLATRGVGAVWVTDTARARETGGPTAARMGLNARVYDHADPAGLLATVAEEGVPALIVGHSNTAPDIARRLGASSEQADSLIDYGMVLESGPQGTRVRSVAELTGSS